MERNHFLDFLRGFALINMIVYHFYYDLVHIFNFSLPWFDQEPGFLWQQGIIMSFVLISGYASNLAKHPLVDGLKLVFWGLVISIVTYCFLPGEFIIFGVLSFLGIASIITYCLKNILGKLPWSLGVVLSLLCFWGTKHLASGVLGFYPYAFREIAESWYNINLLFPLGLPNLQLSSADYVPIFPWLFLFWVGRFLGKAELLPNIGSGRNIFAFSGSHSLFVYLLHQPIIYGVLKMFM